MSKDTGGTAFPVVEYKAPVGGGSHMMTITGGMTLRDYFAAKAMQGMLSNSNYVGASENLIADASYYMADAMLVERTK